MSSLRPWRLRAIRNSPADYFGEATAERQMEVAESLKYNLRLGADGITSGKVESRLLMFFNRAERAAGRRTWRALVPEACPLSPAASAGWF